jgi:elongation factor G
MPDAQPLLVEIAVEPKSKADRGSFRTALATLADELSCGVQTDPSSGQTMLSGASEARLETLIDRLVREFRVDVAVGAPQVAYREAITRAAEIDYIHRKQTGGSGQFARVKLRFEPLPPGSGFVFENSVGDGAMRKEFLPGIEKGLRGASEDGVIAGFPFIDLKIELFDAAYHEVDSSALAFEIAARTAFKEGAVKAGPRLLEPIMRVEVVTLDDCLGDVIGDLNRRGLIIGMTSRDHTRVIAATVPLASMFGYATTLRSISRGLAAFTMQFEQYALVPDHDDDPPPAVAARA